MNFPKESDSKESTTSAICGFPVEIWKEIFEAATSIPFKDEFTSDGMAYLGVSMGRSITSSLYSNNELLEMLHMRSTIVKICRSWYHIGIQALYAHIILRGGTKFAIGLQNLYRTLISSPHLGRYTRRLEISIEVIAHRSCSWDNIISIVALLPGLKMLFGPTGMFLPLNDNEPGPVDLGGSGLQSSRWDTIVIFSVVFTGLESIPRFDTIVLPALQTLMITHAWQAHSPSNIENFATWYFPNLRTLYLMIGRQTWWSCRHLLERHATLLETLIISNIHFNALSEIKLSLPNLKTLSIDSIAPSYCPAHLFQMDTLECSSIREVCDVAGLSKDPSNSSSQQDIDEAERKFVRSIFQYWELHRSATSFEMFGNWNILNIVMQMASTREFVAKLSERGATLEIISEDSLHTRRIYRSLADFVGSGENIT